MAEPPPKRCSYPSSQRRQGPAPLASFEDLSDEIESPTEKNSHPLPEIEEELKLYADAATPSTPRVLDASPVTPGADVSSISTPRVDSFSPCWEEGATTGGSAEFSHEGSRESVLEAAAQVVTFKAVQPNQKSQNHTTSGFNGTNIKNSKSSSFMDDVRGAEAASAIASSLPERSATPECLPQTGPVKKSSLTSGHLSGQSSRTPSRTPSPNSPRRFFSFFKHRDESEPGSPASPKSPRKTSFTNLFKLGGRKSPDDRSVSPTSRKGSLSMFFKSGANKDSCSKLKKTPEELSPTDQPITSKGQKEASNRNVFSSLFKKSDKKYDKKLAQVKLTLQASSVDVPVEIASTGWTSREISLHSHLCDLLDDDGEPLEGTEVPTKQEPVTVINGKHEESVEVYVDAKGPDFEPEFEPDFEPVFAPDFEPDFEPDFAPDRDDEGKPKSDDAETAVAAAFAAQERRSKRLLDRGDALTTEESGQPIGGGGGTIVKNRAKWTSDERISSGSEQETDFDPVSLKKRPTSEDYEVETLITEESADYDDYPTTMPMQSDVIIIHKKSAPVPPIRRQRLVDMTTMPIDRPRSSTPLSVTSIEAYIQTASPPLERAQSDAEKLKVSLPGDEFSSKGRSPRKIMAVKNWQDFCQEALQSPRSKRKDEDEFFAMSTSPPMTCTSWVTFENVNIVPETISHSSTRDAGGVVLSEVSEADLDRSDFMFDASRFSPDVTSVSETTPSVSADDCKCECHKFHTNGVKTPPADASSQTTSSWARDRSTQMPSQDSTTIEPTSQRVTRLEATRNRSTQMPSQDSISLDTPRRSTTIESTSSGELLCHTDSLDGRDPLLFNNGSEDSECEHDTTGEFADAHTCSEHSTSPSTSTFDRCHVFFPHNGDDRNGI